MVERVLLTLPLFLLEKRICRVYYCAMRTVKILEPFDMDVARGAFKERKKARKVAHKIAHWPPWR